MNKQAKFNKCYPARCVTNNNPWITDNNYM